MDAFSHAHASMASSPNEARARELLDRSTAAATALSPYIGYAATAEIAKESVATGRPIRDLVLERGLLDESEVDEILSVDAMTRGASSAARRTKGRPAGERKAVGTARP